jgi:hypothetical protein
MGGKRRLASDIHALLDVRPGVLLLLGDASWWGWVWPVVLDAGSGPRVSEVLRGWRNEDPRALWFRLRDMGPVDRTADPAGAAAQLLWLQARAASGVPVWWEGDGSWQAGGYNIGQRARDERRRLLQHASSQVDDAGQRQATEPRLVMRRAAEGDSPACANGYHGGPESGSRGGGIIDPGTIARRLDAIRGAAEGVRGSIEHIDAKTFTARYAASLGARARVYLDPPYADCVGYPVACGRAKVLDIAARWAAAGARVVLSEAVPLANELGPGWTASELRGGSKPEWVTSFGCDVRALLPPLFSGWAS